MKAIKNFIILLILVIVVSLACQKVEATQIINNKPAFPPGSVATQLSRPTYERNPLPLVTNVPATAVLETLLANTPRSTLTRQPLSFEGLDQYYLAANLNIESHSLDVHEIITYTNRTETPLEAIWLVVEPDRQEDVFTWKSLSWENSVVDPARLEDGLWQIQLISPLNPNDTGLLDLKYHLSLRANGGVLGYTPRQINFGGWYARIPPFRPGAGWIVHEPGPAGENNVYDVADFRVELDLGESGQRLVVAASAPGNSCGGKICFSMLNSRSFAWTASEEYQLLEAEQDGIVLQEYVFPEHSFAGQAGLLVAQQAVKIFQENFGSYPDPSLAMVEADFFDGMEYPGLFFLGQEYYASYDGSPKGYLTALSAHEIAHQWWFAQVGNDQALEPWLDEAVSTYSELIYYEEQYPDLIDWWWEYRVTRFQPGGTVDSTIYDLGGFRPYVNAVYLRGAQFLQELRLGMGDQNFMAFMHAYFDAYQGKIATTEDFFSMLEQFYGLDEIEALRQVYFSNK